MAHDFQYELFKSGDDQSSQIVPLEGKEFLEKFVGEDKKYKDQEELAKATSHSQVHIDRLEKEQEGLRKELEQRVTLEKFLEKLQETRERETTTSSSQEGSEGDTSQQVSDASANQNISSVTNEDVQKMVAETVKAQFTESQEKNLYASNLAKVHDVAKEVLGDNYQIELTKRANALELDEELLSELAAKKPNSFIKMLVKPQGFQHPNLFSTTPESHLNTQAMFVGSPKFEPTGAKPRSYHQKLKKDNPTQYWDPKSQVERIQHAVELGDKYFDV